MFPFNLPTMPPPVAGTANTAGTATSDGALPSGNPPQGEALANMMRQMMQMMSSGGGIAENMGPVSLHCFREF